jgi:hypothetical protein
MIWAYFTLIANHFHSLDRHTLPSLNSSDVVKDQIAMEEAMSILAAKETSSLLAPWPKCHRRYINCDREAAHLRPHHDYFENNCV